MALQSAQVQARASRIRLVLLDVDGVLTDGTVTVAARGDETKQFFIRDGLAIVWARRNGLEVGLLSGRPSGATTRRAAELGLTIVVQDGPDKRAGYEAILAAHGFTHEEVAYMGDDLLDLPVLTLVGLAAAPADAVADVIDRVHWISQHCGGRGAVRELLELVLTARGQWDAMAGAYLG